MIANVSAHRRANAFAQALEEQSLRGAAAVQPEDPAEQADQGPLLALANGLGELPKPVLDPEVKVVQRAQLVAAMEAMFAQGGASADPTVPGQRSRGSHRASPLRKLRPRSRWTKGLAAGGLTVGVAAGAFGGVAAASSDALPGDSLYGLKRGMEDIHLGLTRDDTDRGEIYLDQASTRLSEARRLMERARSGDLDHEQLGEIRRTLNGMTHDATEGHRLLHAAYERDGALGPIQALDTFSRSHRDSWTSLRDRLPVQLTDVGNQVSSVFDAIDEEVAPLQSLLPRPPEKSAESQRSGSTGTSADPSTGTRTPSPSSSARHEDTDDTDGSSTSPRPSDTGSSPAGGLIGGGTDGLFDPPSPDASSPSKETPSSTPSPDITIPPLLPGLIGGLGIDAENEKG
ncbi:MULTISPECIES: DUF5667 domain-containing protein [unclassified Streptomyces]|uniref:DUF5667 domain-containing protein n=1 Tax=unclassified Streptomyces TaxID=2593676 RepID=UPI002E2CDDDC|nr:DUF5667 domain-containing protein [Streptomyces sp. NBC_01423]WSX91664.1 DUF5667 domain-containing protein [Streptomyces sp. NBC_00891]WSY06142.1 DUF5667 domain-containing protein [Streptomyces sp. NBC_00890]WSZ07766.1 DUF5667 domain-containing protein [Streptomyces sp. NBC_00869]WSZ24735.1 DUF5667 domain-containing protein [Streptomyces sp. NBC_00870]